MPPCRACCRSSTRNASARPIRTGLGLKAKINHRSIFDRKNYFYPDLPQGYQISQFKDPIVGEGKIIISLGPDRQGNFEDIEIGIERLHLEQDAGKSMHDQHPTMSYVDLNRSGVALMEIVSKPDMRSSDEAKAYMTKLRTIVRYLGTCDGNMDEGSMRADVNVSVRKPGGEFGTRCEIKNVNSIRFIGQAIEYEARRQIAILEDGGTIDQETRLFDAGQGRDPLDALQGRCARLSLFPRPGPAAARIRRCLCRRTNEGPAGTARRQEGTFRSRDLGLSVYDASVLVSEKAIADYFEAGRRKAATARLPPTGSSTTLLGALNKAGKDIEASSGFARSAWRAFSTSSRTAHLRQDRQGPVRDRLERRRRPRQDRRRARHEAGDRHRRHRKGRRRDHCRQPRQVAQAKAKPTLAGWFVGQVMKSTGGKANPQAVKALVKAKLGVE